MKLTPDGAEVVLDTVSLEAGTYVGTRLLVSSIDVEVDVNRDGDTLDENVEIVLTEEEFRSLPAKYQPQTSSLPPELPTAPEAPTGEKTPPPEPEAPTAPEPPSGGGQQSQQKPEQPPEPEQPEPPSQPAAPYSIVGGLVYGGQYLDEKHTVAFGEKYIVPLWETSFVYDGSSGKIIYDFTLYPLEPKGKQISVMVFTET